MGSLPCWISVSSVTSTLSCSALQSLLLAIDQRDPAAALRDALLEITEDTPDIDAQSLERSLGRLMARNLSPGLIPDAEAFAGIFRIVSA